MEPQSGAPPGSFRVVGAALLVWALGGLAIYAAYFVETPEQFAGGAETAANQSAYADYIAAIPTWAIAAGLVAALGRVAGAVGLLLRRAWAPTAWSVSLAFFLLVLCRAFLFADVTGAMSGAHVAVEVLFLSLGLVAIVYARRARARGWLH